MTILILVTVSCNSPHEKNYYDNLPGILDNMIPSQIEDMFLNLQIDSLSLPKDCRKIIQTNNHDTINILEFDSKKRLIFKQYRQYVHETWNDKMVTMIEGHIYDKGKIIQTIYLHSNTGFKIYKYDYIDNLVGSIYEYEKIPSSEINTNPYLYIKHITNLSELLNFIDTLKIDITKNLVSQTKREYQNLCVNEYFKDKSYKTFTISNTFILDPRTKVVNYSEEPQSLYSYNHLDLSSKISKQYYDDDFTVSKYSYNKDTITVTDYLNGKPYFYRKILHKNIIYLKILKEFDSTRFEENKYKLDKYGFPSEVIINNFYDAKDSVIKMETEYLK